MTIEWVNVGDPANEGQTLSYGGTNMTFGGAAESFRIAKHGITIAHYTEFLNSVAKSDPYGLWSPFMGSD